MEFVFAFLMLFADGSTIDLKYTGTDKADCRTVGPQLLAALRSMAPGTESKVTRQCEAAS